MRKSLPFWILLLFVGCQGTEENPSDIGYDYMPLAGNRFWVYEVEETVYFGEGDSETSTFFYRDIVTNSYIGENGSLVYIFTRQRSANQSNWKNELVYSLQIRNNGLLRTMDNEQQVVMVFPPEDEKKWDGNIYNSSSADEFMMELINGYNLGTKLYQRASKIVQEEDDDGITIRNNRFEVYAQGVGMVEHYYEVLTYCSRNDCLGEQIIDSGRFTHLKLIDNGQF